MDFHMAVIPPTQQRELTPDFDVHQDYDSLVMDICEYLSETDCRFTVSGFGQTEWPVDVPYDLSTVIEQLPGALDDLQRGQNAEIDFYGQGIERLVSFSPLGESVAVRCTSRTTWTPDPDTIHGSRKDVEKLLAGLARDFAVALRRSSPSLAALHPFATWL